MQNDELSVYNLKENYYARWLRTEELLRESRKINVINNVEEIKEGGLPIGTIDNQVILDSEEGHNLIIGTTGSGKTQMTTLPMLYSINKANESVVIKDVRGELYEMTANAFKENGYDVITINLDNPDYGNSWNPFTLPKYLYDKGKKDEALTLVSEFAKTIVYEKATNDPFWQNTAASYLTGLVLSLMENASSDEINFNSVTKLTMLNENDEEIDLLDAYFSSIDKNSAIYKSIASTYLAPRETKSSILSVLNQKLCPYTNRECLSNMLAYTNFDLLKINDKKVAIYIITSNESNENDVLTNIFIRQCYYLLMSEKRKTMFNFIFDDFDNSSSPLNNLIDMLDLGRGNKIRFTFLVKSFIRLNDLYGSLTLELFKESCINILYLLTNDRKTAEDISELCGMQDKELRLVSVEALKRMNIWQAILIKNRLMPYSTKLRPFFDMNLSFGEKAEFKERKKKNIKIFDLNNFFTK